MQNSLYLLRHGQLEKQQVLAGSTDFSLSDFGLEQLLEAKNKLPKIQHVYSSPLKRCLMFADSFAKEHSLALTPSNLVKEMDFGDWDGLAFKSLWQDTSHHSVTIGDFWQDPWNNTPPHGETMELFTARVDQWWLQWLTQKPLGNSLLVSHAGVIKHILARVVNLDIKQNHQLTVFDIPYAALIRVDVFFDENNQAFPKIVF